MKTVYLPLARTTFSMPDAENYFSMSCSRLEEIFSGVIKPDQLLTSPEMLEDFISATGDADLVIYQCVTFIGTDFAGIVSKRFHCPVIVWALREPTIDGTRLKLNSLTGAFSAANKLKTAGHRYSFIFGNPDEEPVREALKNTGKAIALINKLSCLKIGVVGSQPDGFEFGAMDAALLSEHFGAAIIHADVDEMIKRAESYKGNVLNPISELKQKAAGCESIPNANMDKYARLFAVYQEFVAENQIQALASRCWPDYFTGYGVPVCAVLSVLNDKGIPSSCETDIGGALSMFIGTEMSGSPVFFGDPVAVDEDCDAIIFWHCGAGAPCLADREKGATVGVHPNRKIGPTMEFGLKKGEVTIIRLGKDKDGFRMFIMKGAALSEPQKFYGTTVTVRPMGGAASAKIKTFVNDGWEPHFIIAYGNIADALKIFCKLRGISLYEY